jgi:hypothetical protein
MVRWRIALLPTGAESATTGGFTTNRDVGDGWNS